MRAVAACALWIAGLVLALARYDALALVCMVCSVLVILYETTDNEGT